ncbi:DUF1289 domain-containing protein [Rhodobacterales bacterium HKCCE2091]|nr:DUF1289 domain-containing protein [Rhodobacterales bacterium HKCCE2091]
MTDDALPGPVTGPCIDVCKYTREGPEGSGHCIGCSMTEAQKSKFKALDSNTERLAFLTELLAQQDEMGGFRHWPAPYAAKCERKGAWLPDIARDRAA